MNEAETAAYFSAIHQLLLAHFDEEELKTLCLSLGLTYDDLPANSRTNKARELVTHLERRDRLGIANGRNGRSPQRHLAQRQPGRPTAAGGRLWSLAARRRRPHPPDRPAGRPPGIPHRRAPRRLHRGDVGRVAAQGTYPGGKSA
ncbi:MAG: hypothetical protein IPJ94_17840 [Chloroflexi bacterium]|nr:hypothetical protein [Chloroflexota bacterium]